MAAAGRIGPNAITRIAEALPDDQRGLVFARAGLGRYLLSPPTMMVPDDEVAALHRSLRDSVTDSHAERVSRLAGQLTGEYLLTHRIPRLAQWLLRPLPWRLSFALLLKAIARHAWTFSGAGRFSYELGSTPSLIIAGGPVSRHVRSGHPACAYYAATFETIFRAIVHPAIVVEETACESMGHDACVFTVRIQSLKN